MKKQEQKLEIADYIDHFIEAKNKRDELEVRFGTKTHNPITKITFDNTIEKLRSFGFTIEESNKYTLNIQNEYTDMASGRKKLSNIRTTISGLDNIQRYCKTNTFDIEDIPSHISFMQKFYKVKNPQTNEKFYPLDKDDYEFRLNYKVERKLTKKMGLLNNILNTWNDSKKTFRLIKRTTLSHYSFPFVIDCSIIKTSKHVKKTSRMVPTYTVQDSNVFKNMKHYEIEIELVNDKCYGLKPIVLERLLKKTIQYVLSGLQFTNFPVSYMEMNSVLKQYLEMTQNEETYKKLENDSFQNRKKRKSRKYFIGPSSITLEMNNIVPLDSVVATNENINHPYSVTEKADGIRKLLYIANNKKIYLIDINLNVQFTGLVTQNEDYRNTLIDGEHVLYNKFGEFINYYLCFDIYYINDEDVRMFPFIKIDNITYETKMDQNKFRYNLLNLAVNKLDTTAKSKNAVNLNIQVKDFYINGLNNSIFKQCKVILDKEKNGGFPYETDGLIFTPIDKSVGSTKVGILENMKTWTLSFKWKPPSYNTIDFLVKTKKNENGTEFVGNIFDNTSYNGVNQYKTLLLCVGFSEKRHGFINPCNTVIEDEIFENISERDDYKAAPFYPTEPTPNFKIHECNIMLKNRFSSLKMLTEDGKQEILDNMIVEFRFDMDAEQHWQWIPIRVRYDKTEDYRRGGRNFGNAYHVAQSVWRSINNPVTEEVITTGENINDGIFDENVYYNRKSKQTNTASLRDFHNRYVKKKLITSVANRGNTLFDMSVGKAGDIQKWLDAKLSFVFGIDYSKDNIENRMDGACARYIKKKRKIKNMFDALFIHGSATLNIKDTTSAFDARGKRIISALNARGEKDRKRLGAGVYKQWGKAKNGFDIISNQFSIHYFFSDNTSLNEFVRNCAENTKLNGHVIGTCYDGEKIFNRLKTKNYGENIFHNENGKKMWSITKMYEETEFKPDLTSLGYKIDVYQESINKSFVEYLVNFEYLKTLMYNYGFVVLSKEEANKIGLPNGIGSFKELYDNMLNQHKRKRVTSYQIGKALSMTEKEKDISFLNNYFVFKKVREVSVMNVFNVEIMKTDATETKGIEKKGRDIIRKIMAERIQKIFIRKFSKKFRIPNNIETMKSNKSTKK